MTTPPPLACNWDGTVFRPLPGAARAAERHFTPGGVYPLVVQEPRSQASHAQYFALITEAWQTLPEDLASDFPSSEHLRKWALIKAGHCDMRTLVCSSKAEAQRTAAFVRPLDPFAIVTVRDAVVTVYTAHSQSFRAMGKAAFQKSKDDVLRIIGELIGADPSQLGRAA